MAANKSPIRIAVSIKKGSGTILIKRSVAGFKIHRSLSKNIWWKTTKYLEKSVDMIPAIPADSRKKSPVPMLRELGSI